MNTKEENWKPAIAKAKFCYLKIMNSKPVAAQMI